MQKKSFIVHKYHVLLFIFLFSTISVSDSTYIEADQSILFENQSISNEAYEFYQYSRIIVRNCQLDNVSFDIMDSVEVVFESNTFINSPDITLTFWGITSLTIYGNTMLDAAETALQIYETGNANITGNSFILNDYNPNDLAINVGVKLDRSEGTTFMNNYINCPLGDGLQIFNSPESVIENNTIENSGFISIAVLMSSRLILNNNHLINSSSFIADDVPPSSALLLSDSSNMQIINNYIVHSVDSGIAVDLLYDSIIANNTIIDHEIGIFIGRSENITLDNNIIEQVKEGIIIDQSTDVDVFNDNGVSVSTNSESETKEAPLLYPWLILPFILLTNKTRKKPYE